MTRVRAGEQPLPVLALTKRREDRFTDRLAGKAVGHESFEAVADFDPDLAILDRDDDQQAVVLAAIADAPSVVLEHLDGVFLDVGVGLKRGHGGDHDDIAAGTLQGLNPSIELALARLVDHIREVVDRPGEGRRQRLRDGCGGTDT